MVNILIADDEPRIRELIREHLEHEGFSCEETADGSATLAALQKGGIDLVLLDIMMPFVDGMTVLREIRSRKLGVPAIMITARGEEYDKVAGLEGGADDYVVKPFSPRELLARVRAVLARTLPKEKIDGENFVFGGLMIDTMARNVKVDGVKVDLTPKEFELLVFMVTNRGIALTREVILQKVWNYDYVGEDRTVDTHVKMLRSHLGPYRAYIATVWGVGYKFEQDGI
jgi:two-component system response regulator ResD